MPFDPAQPFEVVDSPPASFDPSKPFEVVEAPAPTFNPTQPFEPVADGARREKKAKLQDELAASKRMGSVLGGVVDAVGAAEYVTEALTRPVSGVVGKLFAPITGSNVVEEALKMPLAPTGRFEEAETTAGKIAAGTGNAILEFVESFSTPDMIAQLPAGVSKTVLAGWASAMAAHAPEKLLEANTLRKEGKLQEAVQAAVTGMGSGLMAAGIGRSLTKTPKGAEVVQEPGTVAVKDIAPPRPEFSSEALTTPKSEVIGIAPDSVPKHFLTDLKSTLKEWFVIGGHLPEDVVQLKREMEGKISAQDQQIKFTTRDFNSALKEVYDLSETEMIGGGSKRIPVADVQKMNAFLKGEVDATALPDRLVGPLETMRAEISGLSEKMVSMLEEKLDGLDAESPAHQNLSALVEKIRNNSDTYVTRSYQFFDSKKPAPRWYEDLPANIRMDAERYLQDSSPGRAMTQSEAQSTLLRWLSDLKDEAQGTRGAAFGAKDLSLFIKRKDIPKELRDVLGEHNNPLVNYARSVEKMSRWIANENFLNEVRSKGIGEFLFEEGADPVGFNARIAAEGSEGMSPLDGLRTSPEIAAAFKDINRVYKRGALATAYLRLNAATKVAATVQSIMTQSRNLLSRPFMATFAGHYNVGESKGSIKAVYEQMLGTDAQWRSKLLRYAELKVIGDTSRATELREILKDASLNDVGPTDLHSWSMARYVKRLGYDIPASVYKLSDELGNIFGFENEKAIQRQIHPDWTETLIEERAAKVVRELYPAYSEAPKAVNDLRQVAVVGPFVNFPFQVWRTMWNGLSQSVSEMRSSNPVEQRVGLKRLTGQIATLGATYGLQEVAKNMLGIDSREEEDFRMFQPFWSKNSKWLFTGKDKQGELSAINLSYQDPFSYATDIVPAVLSAVRNGTDPFEAFANVTAEMLRPWVSEQMLFKAIIEARNGKTDLGRPIVNTTDSTLEKTQKRIRHVAEAFMPGTVNRINRRILPALLNEQPSYGQKFDLSKEIARELTGVAYEKFDFKTAFQRRSDSFFKAEDDAESVFRSMVGRQKTTTDEQMVEAYTEANRRRFMVWQDLRRSYLAVLRRGVSSEDAEDMMKIGHISKRDARAISDGEYVPIPITDSIIARADKRNRVVPLEKIQSAKDKIDRISLDKPMPLTSTP